MKQPSRSPVSESATFRTNVSDISRARKEISIPEFINKSVEKVRLFLQKKLLVERRRHDSVGALEGLLHAITMMDVDIYVQRARVVLQQLQNGQHDIIHIAEATSLHFLCVVKTS